MTNGLIQNYTVTCNNSGTFTFDVTTQDEQISVTLDANFNFDPFTTYECTVSATTNGGVGNDSEPSVATTEQDGREEIALVVLDITFILCSSISSKEFHTHKGG